MSPNILSFRPDLYFNSIGSRTNRLVKKESKCGSFVNHMESVLSMEVWAL